jgi:hypothetical protein
MHVRTSSTSAGLGRVGRVGYRDRQIGTWGVANWQRYFRFIEFLRGIEAQNDPLWLATMSVVRLASRVMRPAFPLLPLALAVSAAAGLVVGSELHRAVRVFSSQPVGSPNARAYAAQQRAADAAPRGVADAIAAISRHDFIDFLEALELTTPSDLASLWDVVSSRSGPEQRRYFDAFMDRCGEIAPELGLQFLDRQTGPRAEREESRNAYFVVWAGHHPQEAIETAVAWPEGADRQSLLRAAAMATAKAHPEIFFQERERLRGPGSAFDPFKGPTNEETAPEAALTASIYDGFRAEALEVLIRRDPARAMKIWETMDGDDRFRAGLLLARVWAASDPAAAEAWTRTWPKPDDRTSGLDQIANAISERDPERAGSLLVETHEYDRNPRGPNYSKLRAYSSYGENLGTPAVDLVLQRLLRDDPAAAQDWARRYLPAQADYQVGRALAATLPSDVDLAVDRLTRLEAPALAEAVEVVTQAWQPQGVLARLEELVQRFPEDRRDAGRALLLASAVRREPEAVIAMAMTLPEGSTRQTLLNTAFDQWIERSPAEASAWLGAVPAGPSKDGMIFQTSDGLAESDPTTACAWLVTTADGPARDQALENVAEEWARRDPEAARAAIEALAIDDKLKAQLLETITEVSKVAVEEIETEVPLDAFESSEESPR